LPPSRPVKQGTMKNAQLKKVNSQLGKKEIMWVAPDRLRY
jgi:hypothetical protein